MSENFPIFIVGCGHSGTSLLINYGYATDLNW
jgi:hypothetical protein